MHCFGRHRLVQCDAGRFSSSLVIADQNRLFDPFVGRVLKIMANGREEIGPCNGLFEFG